MNDTDLVIVGGGVIGLAIGWRALETGLSVTLLERDAGPAQRASRVAAGMLAPGSTAAARQPALLDAAMESARLYPDFAAELAAETGHDPGLQNCASLLLAADADEIPPLEAEIAFRESRGLAVSRLEPAEARRLEPALAPNLELAVEVPDDRAIEPPALCAALARAFTRAGGVLRPGTDVSAVSISHRMAHGVRLSNGETLSAANVVIAAGPWSDAVGGIPADAQIPLRPVKGQILALRDPDGPGRLARAVRTASGYLVPRGDGRYVLGATVEERGFDTTSTAGAVASMLAPTIRQVPAVAGWLLEELQAGIRPATPDGLPVIGPSPVIGNLHWATGHHRQGVLLAPLTAELVIDGLLARPTSAFGVPLAPDRFTASPDQAVAAGGRRPGAEPGSAR